MLVNHIQFTEPTSAGITGVLTSGEIKFEGDYVIYKIAYINEFSQTLRDNVKSITPFSNPADLATHLAKNFSK